MIGHSQVFFLQLALVVAQTRDGGRQLTGIKLPALSTGLQRIARCARKRAGLLLLHYK